MSVDVLKAQLDQVRDRVIDFTCRLVQTPSLPGAEARLATVIQREMEALGYDDVSIDSAGNVIGQLRGGDGPTLMFNAHMDHVDPGDPARWPVPPYSGEVRDEAIWGRGAVDVKGPLAAQVYGVALLRAAGLKPAGDVYVTAVVMEEVGGIGTQALLEHLRADFAVVGEPSNLQIARGHRGRVELVARVQGRSAHASQPALGLNPHYDLARFLLALERLEMRSDPEFGTSSVTPTLYHTDQASSNVIPGEVWVHLDWRNIPGESPSSIRERLQELLTQNLQPGSQGFVVIPDQTFETYTGHLFTAPAVFPSFALPADHPLVTVARHLLSQTLEREVSVTTWQFATDGGHLMEAGVPTIGFAPGDENLAHTAHEHILIEQLLSGCLGYAVLARELGARLAGAPHRLP